MAEKSFEDELRDDREALLSLVRQGGITAFPNVVDEFGTFAQDRVFLTDLLLSFGAERIIPMLLQYVQERNDSLGCRAGDAICALGRRMPDPVFNALFARICDRASQNRCALVACMANMLGELSDEGSRKVREKISSELSHIAKEDSDPKCRSIASAKLEYFEIGKPSLPDSVSPAIVINPRSEKVKKGTWWKFWEDKAPKAGRTTSAPFVQSVPVNPKLLALPILTHDFDHWTVVHTELNETVAAWDARQIIRKENGLSGQQTSALITDGEWDNRTFSTVWSESLQEQIPVEKITCLCLYVFSGQKRTITRIFRYGNDRFAYIVESS